MKIWGLQLKYVDELQLRNLYEQIRNMDEISSLQLKSTVVTSDPTNTHSHALLMVGSLMMTNLQLRRGHKLERRSMYELLRRVDDVSSLQLSIVQYSYMHNSTRTHSLLT